MMVDGEHNINTLFSPRNFKHRTKQVSLDNIMDATYTVQKNPFLEVRLKNRNLGINLCFTPLMIASKVKHLFKTQNFKLARLTHCGTHWWTRGSSSGEKTYCGSLTSFVDESSGDFETLNWYG